MPKTDSSKVILIDGVIYARQQDGHLAPVKDKTDWAALDAMTDEELEKFVQEDEDGAEFREEDWDQALEERRLRLAKNAPQTKLG